MMSKDLAVYAAPSQAQIDILRTSICRELNNDQLQYFLAVCQRRGLDPFASEIHAVIRGGRMVIQTGVDGARSLAERTGEYEGQDEPEYDCEPDGKARHPNWARVTVYRRINGERRGFPARLFWSEFAGDTPIWKRMPWHMLAKCAEIQALRKAFPRQVAGMLEPAEPVYSDDVVAPVTQPVAVTVQSLESRAKTVPPAVLAEWNRALAAFSAIGKKAPDLLAYAGVAEVAELTPAHFREFENWYTDLTQPAAEDFDGNS